jgi:hypothetical protein
VPGAIRNTLDSIWFFAGFKAVFRSDNSTLPMVLLDRDSLLKWSEMGRTAASLATLMMRSKQTLKIQMPAAIYDPTQTLVIKVLNDDIVRI